MVKAARHNSSVAQHTYLIPQAAAEALRTCVFRAHIRPVEALARLEQYTLCDVPAAAAVPPRLREARFKHCFYLRVQAVKPVFVPKAQHALLPAADIFAAKSAHSPT